MVSRSLFGIEILHSVLQYLDRLLPGIKVCVLFWASTSCKLEVKEDLDTEKKIEKSRYPKKDISILGVLRPSLKVVTNSGWLVDVSR